MTTSNPHGLNSGDVLDPGAGPSTSPSDRVQASHHTLSEWAIEEPATADSSGSRNIQLAKQKESEAIKQIQEDKENRKRLLRNKQELERLMADKSDKELQEVLALPSHEYELRSQELPDRSNDFSSFDAGLCEKVMRFMVNVHLRTGADIEPRQAFILVVQAGRDEKLALEKYLFTNPPITPTRLGFVNSNVTSDLYWGKHLDHDRKIVPLPSGRLQSPPKADVEAVVEREEPRKTIEEIQRSGEEGEKKRGMFSKLFRVGEKGESKLTELAERIKRKDD